MATQLVQQCSCLLINRHHVFFATWSSFELFLLWKIARCAQTMGIRSAYLHKSVASVKYFLPCWSHHSKWWNTNSLLHPYTYHINAGCIHFITSGVRSLEGSALHVVTDVTIKRSSLDFLHEADIIWYRQRTSKYFDEEKRTIQHYIDLFQDGKSPKSEISLDISWDSKEQFCCRQLHSSQQHPAVEKIHIFPWGCKGERCISRRSNLALLAAHPLAGARTHKWGAGRLGDREAGSSQSQTCGMHRPN